MDKSLLSVHNFTANKGTSESYHHLQELKNTFTIKTGITIHLSTLQGQETHTLFTHNNLVAIKQNYVNNPITH